MNLVTSRQRILIFFLIILVFPRAKNDIYHEGNYVYIIMLASQYYEMIYEMDHI